MRYTLKVPRVKKRKEHREERERPISKPLGDLLWELRDRERADSTGAEPRAEAPLVHWLGAAAEGEIGPRMQRWVRAIDLVSPRTGEILILNPRRLRYTLATEMARQGASRRKIADVLDHTDLQNVEVYIEASSYVADQVGSKLGPRLDPKVQRFMGKVATPGQHAASSGVPRQVVPGSALQLPVLPLEMPGVGLCGSKAGLCDKSPPLHCYTCDKFEAWPDGPHDRVAAAIEERIATEWDGDADIRIPQQLIDALLAIRQLQQQFTPNKDTAA